MNGAMTMRPEWRIRVRCANCSTKYWITNAQERGGCGPCRSCGQSRLKTIKGFRVHEAKAHLACGEKCQTSLSGSCDCSCGGANHGKAL